LTESSYRWEGNELAKSTLQCEDLLGGFEAEKITFDGQVEKFPDGKRDAGTLWSLQLS
jgi:hypothetical protein